MAYINKNTTDLGGHFLDAVYLPLTFHELIDDNIFRNYFRTPCCIQS